MTLRAGSYDASRPRLRGVIRDDGDAWYACSHEHGDRAEARECARAALPAVKEVRPNFLKHDPLLIDGLLPEGWRVFDRKRDEYL